MGRKAADNPFRFDVFWVLFSHYRKYYHHRLPSEREAEKEDIKFNPHFFICFYSFSPFPCLPNYLHLARRELYTGGKYP